MVRPKIQTLKNQFQLYKTKFENCSTYLASQLDARDNVSSLQDILTELRTSAAKLEDLACQLSAHLSGDDLEKIFQHVAESSLTVLQHSDCIRAKEARNHPSPASSRPSTAFKPVQRRCDDFTSTFPEADPTSAIDPQPQSPNVHQLQTVSEEVPSDTHLLDMTGDQLTRHLAAISIKRSPPIEVCTGCLLYTSPSPRDLSTSRMPSSA